MSLTESSKNVSDLFAMPADKHARDICQDILKQVAVLQSQNLHNPRIAHLRRLKKRIANRLGINLGLSRVNMPASCGKYKRFGRPAKLINAGNRELYTSAPARIDS